jgi:hypothetical protein
MQPRHHRRRVLASSVASAVLNLPRCSSVLIGLAATMISGRVALKFAFRGVTPRAGWAGCGKLDASDGHRVRITQRWRKMAGVVQWRRERTYADAS